MTAEAIHTVAHICIAVHILASIYYYLRLKGKAREHIQSTIDLAEATQSVAEKVYDLHERVTKLEKK